ncbi:hypothetical protein CSUI_009366, partial [Cystoisospora suis]
MSTAASSSPPSPAGFSSPSSSGVCSSSRERQTIPPAVVSLLPLLGSSSCREKFQGLLRCSTLFTFSQPSPPPASQTVESSNASESLEAIIRAVRPSFLRQVILSPPLFSRYALELVLAFFRLQPELTARLLLPCFPAICCLLLKEGQASMGTDNCVAPGPSSMQTAHHGQIHTEAPGSKGKQATEDVKTKRLPPEPGTPEGLSSGCLQRQTRQAGDVGEMTGTIGTEEVEEEEMSNLREATEASWRFSVILGRRALWRALKEAGEILAEHEGKHEDELRFHQQFEEVLANIDGELETLKAREVGSSGRPDRTVSPRRETGKIEEDYTEEELEEKGFQLNRRRSVGLGSHATHRSGNESREGGKKKEQGSGASGTAIEQESAHADSLEKEQAPLLTDVGLSLTDLLLPYLEKAPRRLYLNMLLDLLMNQENELTLVSIRHIHEWLQQTTAAASGQPLSVESCLLPAVPAKTVALNTRLQAGAAAELETFRKQDLQAVVAKVGSILRSSLPWSARADVFSVTHILLQLFGLSWTVRKENRGLLLVSIRLSAVEIRLYFDDVLNQLTENQSIARTGGHSGTGAKDGHLCWFGVDQGRRDRTKLITTACGLMETAIGAFTKEADFMETELGSDAYHLLESASEAIEAVLEFVEEIKARSALASYDWGAPREIFSPLPLASVFDPMALELCRAASRESEKILDNWFVKLRPVLDACHTGCSGQDKCWVAEGTALGGIIPSFPGPEVHNSLASRNSTLTRGVRLCALSGIVSFCTFCLNVLPPPDGEDEEGRDVTQVVSDERSGRWRDSPSPAVSSSWDPSISSPSSPSSSPPFDPFPRRSSVASWWRRMRCVLRCSGPEYTIQQLLEKFIRFELWPGDQESPVKTLFLWRCEVVSSAAALAGVRCSQQALLDIVRPRDLLRLWGMLVRQFIILTPLSSNALRQVQRPDVALWYRTLRVLLVCVPHQPSLVSTLHCQLKDYE